MSWLMKKLGLKESESVSFDSLQKPELLFGFTYFSHMIPPYKPDSILILGYGNGTIAELMRKIWGSEIKITGVDIQPSMCQYIEYEMFTQDAFDYVKKCADSIIKKRFDYIVVDLWKDGYPCDEIFTAEFAARLREMSKSMISVNCQFDDFHKRRMKNFYDYGFEYEHHVQVGGNVVSFWSVIKK